MSEEIDFVAAYEALHSLDFGKVDSESEPDLDRRFVRTSDFDRFLEDSTALILGAKGTGKSALFELLAKYEDVARDLAPQAMRNVIVAAGTGFSDLSEIATGDIERLRSENGFDHDRLWRLYIAVRSSLAAGRAVDITRGPVRDLLVGLGAAKDVRIGPILRGLWQLAVGDAPAEVTVAAGGATVTLKGGKRQLDVVSLLQDVETSLSAAGKRLWLLFDKVDEIFPTDRVERVRSLQGLMTASMAIRRTFPSIQPKVMLRTDIWRDLDFTNKSHLIDKQVELRWSRDELAWLILKRAISAPEVRSYVARLVPTIEQYSVEALDRDERDRGLQAILPVTVYPGEREAEILDWISARVTDAQGTSLPRETILLCNLAVRNQRSIDSPPGAGGSLLSREAVREAFPDVSRLRCQTYLAEFPSLREHFRRFDGQTTATFTRDQLGSLMEGLMPAGDDLLRELHEIGVLQPLRGNVATAVEFEIPRLYRIGLGLVIRGRA